jgi:phosphate transport system permease protein
MSKPAAKGLARESTHFDTRDGARRGIGQMFAVICLIATVTGIVFLGVLLADLWRDGGSRLSAGFLNGFPSRLPARAGIKPALLGSLWTLLLTAIISFPIGVGTAIWLEEYADKNRFTRLIQTNIANLAGVPSIVYGILGLTLFVRMLNLGNSILAGALTLALLILPVVIIASQEAIKAVPNSIRLGAYALGATRWETVRFHVLPQAMPGVLTGTILALSRAIGEAAPMIMVGAAAYIGFIPRSPMDQFTVIPIQIFNWVSMPQTEFQAVAAAGSIVLLAALLTLNAVAILLRNKYSRRS